MYVYVYSFGHRYVCMFAGFNGKMQSEISLALLLNILFYSDVKMEQSRECLFLFATFSADAEYIICMYVCM